VRVTKIEHARGAQVAGIARPGDVARIFRFDTAERKSFIVYADSAKEKVAWMEALSRTLSPPPPQTAIEDIFKKQLESSGRTAEGEKAGAWQLNAQGLRLAREGRRTEAIAKFEAALTKAAYVPNMVKLMPQCLFALYELGKQLCELGQYAEALAKFEAALLMGPPETSNQLKLQCAWCSWQLGMIEEADLMYHAILDADWRCWHALLDRSRMHLDRADWAAGLSDLELVIALGRDSAEIRNDRGVCYFELEIYKEALADFDATLQRNPKYAQAYINRGNCYRKQAMHEEARQDYGRAIELDAKNSKAYNNRGALHLKDGRFEEALADFERALVLEPHSEVAVNNRDLAQQRVEDAKLGAEARSAAIASRYSVGGKRN